MESRISDILNRMNDVNREFNALKREYEKLKRAKTAHSVSVSTTVKECNPIGGIREYDHLNFNLEGATAMAVLETIDICFTEQGKELAKKLKEMQEELKNQ